MGPAGSFAKFLQSGGAGEWLFQYEQRKQDSLHLILPQVSGDLNGSCRPWGFCSAEATRPSGTHSPSEPGHGQLTHRLSADRGAGHTQDRAPTPAPVTVRVISRGLWFPGCGVVTTPPSLRGAGRAVRPALGRPLPRPGGASSSRAPRDLGDREAALTGGDGRAPWGRRSRELAVPTGVWPDRSPAWRLRGPGRLQPLLPPLVWHRVLASALAWAQTRARKKQACRRPPREMQLATGSACGCCARF